MTKLNQKISHSRIPIHKGLGTILFPELPLPSKIIKRIKETKIKEILRKDEEPTPSPPKSPSTIIQNNVPNVTKPNIEIHEPIINAEPIPTGPKIKDKGNHIEEELDPEAYDNK